jgi:hypothetical protein
MSDLVSTQFGLMVPHGRLGKCIVYLEDGLRSLKKTPYHRVLGGHFLDQANEMGEWLIDFHRKAVAAKLKLAAIYLEMNGFAINPDQWHCDAFGYVKAGDIWDLDWLSSWDLDREECFVLRGMESVQEAFAELFFDKDKSLGVGLAQEITEHLVTARFMELVAAGHKAARRRYPNLRGMPVLATAHDWDTVHQTQ